MRFDVAVVGGGIVGAATAHALKLRAPRLSCVLVEKEAALVAHQSSHNSGVIHAGIYYQPGSQRAKLCVTGARMMYEFCAAQGIAVRRVGKLIVAARQEELPRLQGLLQRGRENGVQGLELLEGAAQIRRVEPFVSGLAAILSPHTGVADYGEVGRRCAELFRGLGGQVVCGYAVDHLEHSSLRGETVLRRPAAPSGNRGGASSPPNAVGSDISARIVVVCSGLHSDVLARKSGGSVYPIIVPIRGSYVELRPEASARVRRNVYPVPDPQLPFLGVHFTPRVDGVGLLGPTATLALSREGYSLTQIRPRELLDLAGAAGFRRLVNRHMLFGVEQVRRELSLQAIVDCMQPYLPWLQTGHVLPGRRFAGVRAQALSEQGHLIDDFVMEELDMGGRSVALFLRNASSPAATSSLALGKQIAERAAELASL
jgi:2-hydroxyglutarate dehydrogenase